MYKSVDNYDCICPVYCSPAIEVSSNQGKWGEYRSCEASAPWVWVTPPHSIPSCIMTTLTLVRGALNLKCKDLMLCLGNHFCQLEGGRAWRAKWLGKGRGLHPVRSLVFFPCKKLQERIIAQASSAMTEHHQMRVFLGVVSL